MAISLFWVAEAHLSSGGLGDFPSPLTQICCHKAHNIRGVLFKIEYHAVGETFWPIFFQDFQ